MRFVIVAIPLFLVLGLGFLSLSKDDKSKETTRQVPTNPRKTSVKHRTMFTVFRSPLEGIDPEATLTEVSVFATKLYGTHPLVDEWIPICFRLRTKGSGSFSDVKRFAELQIQMLSDIDSEKHAEEIKAYQVSLQDLEQVKRLYKSAKGLRLPLRTPQEVEAITGGWNLEAFQHLTQFRESYETDQEAARAEIDEIAKIRFGEHPLAEEWEALYFRLSSQGNGLFSELKKFYQLEIQMLTDISAETYAEVIEQHRKTLGQYEEMIKVFPDTGKNPDSFLMDFKYPSDHR